MNVIIAIAAICQAATGHSYDKEYRTYQLQCQQELIRCVKTNSEYALHGENTEILAKCILEKK